MSLPVQPSIAVQDESPHSGCPIEWWFVQGHFEGPNSPACHFMTAFFRHRMAETPSALDGHWLLASVLGAASGEAESLSRIDRASLDQFLGRTGALLRTNLDPLFATAYADEVAARGPEPPIEVAGAAPVFQADPFGVHWSSYSLDCGSECIRMSFRLSGNGPDYRFDLRPTMPRVTLPVGRFDASGGMAYATSPALSLRGSAGDSRVTGQAWLDHQWGSTGWLVGRGRLPRIAGWDWLAVSLDSGERLITCVRFDARRRRVLSKWAVLMEPGKRPRVFGGVVTSPSRWWRSPDTGIDYPVAWDVAIRAARAAFASNRSPTVRKFRCSEGDGRSGKAQAALTERSAGVRSRGSGGSSSGGMDTCSRPHGHCEGR